MEARRVSDCCGRRRRESILQISWICAPARLTGYFLTGRAWRSATLIMMGCLTFISAASTATKYGSVTLALADVDGNGTLDLYVANNRTDDIRDRGQVDLQMVNGKLAVPTQFKNRLVIVDGKLLEYGEPDILYLNDGHGRFSAVSWTDGTFLDELGNKLSGPPLDWGLTVTFRDMNGDGSPDIYVCNDYWTPDRIWINDGSGRFRAVAQLAIRHTSENSMGVDFADIDR